MHIIKKYIVKLIRKENLKLEEMQNVLSYILKQSISISQMSSILTLLSYKINTLEELAGALNILYAKWGAQNVYDRKIFSMKSAGNNYEYLSNISLQIGLIISSLDIGFIDFEYGSHLNNNSINIIANLGYDTKIDIVEALRIFEQTNYFFIEESKNFKIPTDYYLLKEDLGFVNFFEVIKSLYEPIKCSHRLFGLADTKYKDVISQYFIKEQKENAWIISNKDGIDKISLSSVNYITCTRNGKLSEFILDPQDYFSCQDMEYKSLKELMDDFYYKKPSPYLLINLAACLAVMDNQSSFDKIYLEKAEELVKNGTHIKKCQQIIGCSSYAQYTSSLHL